MWTTGSLQIIAKVIAYDEYPEGKTLTKYFRSIVQNYQPQYFRQKQQNNQKYAVGDGGIAKETAIGGNSDESTCRVSQPNGMGTGL